MIWFSLGLPLLLCNERDGFKNLLSEDAPQAAQDAAQAARVALAA